MRTIIPAQADLSQIQDKIDGLADTHKDDLWRVNKQIHGNPEPHYKEVQAHDNICGLLESLGYAVTPHAYGVPTAFQVEFGTGGGLVSYNAEYDALPCESDGYHHACGHNLIATSSIAAFLFTAGVIKDTGMQGRVRLLGTPAEESGGGKIDLIDAGAYRGVDASLMAHPSNDIESFDGISCPKTLAINSVKIKFHGKEAHAAASPWAGINALDAVVATYNNIAMLRQQLPLTERVHSIISNGGERPNIIPGLAEMELYARAATDAELETLCKRLEGCIHGGAQAAGCKVELTWDRAYKNLRNNETIARVFSDSMRVMGKTFQHKLEDSIGGSTDQGNVTHEIPGIHPMFVIPTPGGVTGPHTSGFAEAAGTYDSFLRALDVGKGLASAGYQILADPELRQQAWDEHANK
ncbi:uncharacterized protein N7503_001090 [Penicillium pulvis]|uniref:uncharacterized protein n=1 Tax=Penicillium pulvis TaxID=1562058 RepID=UPI002547E98D|nr:uncharacterized protein N7503_001090 [Penicillium pulvis]KAJ5814340.1 hypothetical protein N7503_001090 [Penicillium pulvis]